MRLALPFIVVLLASSATATTVRPEQVGCPVCETDITVLTVTSSNSFGGPDYDLCGHAAGEDPRSFSVWTCTYCLYSRLSGRFEDGVAHEIAERIRTELKSPVPIPEGLSQRVIPGWVKYTLAGTILEWEGAEPGVLADHYLSAAWTCRSESGRPLRAARKDPLLAEIWKSVSEEIRTRHVNQPPKEPREMFSNCIEDIATAETLLEQCRRAGTSIVDVQVRLFHAADRLRWRGENLRAEAALDGMPQPEDGAKSVAGVVKGMREGIARERMFQEKALANFLNAIESREIEGRELAAVAYILGDTCRRLARPAEASEWYIRSLNVAEGPAWAYLAALGALDRLGADKPPAEKLAEIKQRRLDSLVARLGDPETTRDARNELSLMREKSVEPGIVAALSSESHRVRANAALALKDQPEPGAEAVDALTRVLLTDPEQEPRWRAAVALEEIGSPGSREALEQSYLKEEDDQVLRTVIGALGFVGTEATLPALLTGYNADPDGLPLALARLANREVPELNSRHEFLAWWEKRRPGNQREWARRGFAEAGIDLADPWSRESIPALLDLLEDERHWIRANAVRVLREISGRRLPWQDIAHDADYPRARTERKAAANRWREWYESTRKK